MFSFIKRAFSKINKADKGLEWESLSEAGFEPRLFEISSGYAPTKKVKTVAFHLPQFYEFEENNEWWGKGFTEWTNVVKATPQFKDHYQPRLPHEIGFYSLNDKQSVHNQVLLASAAGIDAFCFYYYHLSGKKLLREPVDHMMGLETDFEFCFCWANENWTRRWDAAEHQLLARQIYDDREIEAIIDDISGYMLKPNYLKIENRPFLIIYEPAKVPDLEGIIDKLRAGIFTKTGMKPYLGYIWRGESRKQYRGIFDIGVSFPLHYPGQKAFKEEKIAGRQLHSYPLMMKNSMSESHPRADIFKCCIPSWDNTARLQERASVFDGSNPNLFGKWYEQCVQSAIEQKHEFVFINAWNEWAEGNHLEPDQKYGYANLNRIWAQQQLRAAEIKGAFQIAQPRTFSVLNLGISAWIIREIFSFDNEWKGLDSLILSDDVEENGIFILAPYWVLAELCPGQIEPYVSFLDKYQDPMLLQEKLLDKKVAVYNVLSEIDLLVTHLKVRFKPEVNEGALADFKRRIASSSEEDKSPAAATVDAFYTTLVRENYYKLF